MTLYIQPDNSLIDLDAYRDRAREVVIGTLRVEPSYRRVEICTHKRFHERTGYSLQWASTDDPQIKARVDTILLLLE